MPRRYYPRHAPVLDAQGRLSPLWERFFRTLLDIPPWVKAAEQATLDAALAPTIIARVPTVAPAPPPPVDPGPPPPPPPPPPPGTPVAPVPAVAFALSYYVQITQPATVSSEIIVTFTFVDQGVTQTVSSPAIVGNTTSTTEQDSQILIQADAGTTITVETSYVSVGADPVEYDLIAAVEPVADSPIDVQLPD